MVTRARQGVSLFPGGNASLTPRTWVVAGTSAAFSLRVERHDQNTWVQDAPLMPSWLLLGDTEQNWVSRAAVPSAWPAPGT